MKKVLSLVLVLALVLGSFSMAFAAVPTDVEGTDWENAVTALSELGVVEGYPDGTYLPNKTVTRAEAAKLVITALGLGEYAGSNTASFTDTVGHWAEGYIGYAEALGVLKGVGNGLYNPEGLVTYEQIATMLVRAVGYTDASLPGTWPANYVVKAKALNIMDGISQAGSVAANRGDVAIMLYNNLTNAIGTVDADNKWGANTPADSMLKRLDQQVYTLPDSLSGTAVAAWDDAFIYTGAQTVADGVNIEAYLGAVIVAYANADNEITGVKDVKTTFLKGEFATNDMNQGTKFYVDDAAETTLKMKNTDSTRVNFVNSESTSTAISLTTSGIVIAADVDGNYIKEVYSVSKWDGTTVQWTSAMEKALDKNDKLAGKSFVMTSKDEIDTTSFALLGVDTLADIEVDDVVTYYLKNGEVKRVEVSDATIEGKVTKKATDGKLTINGVKYSNNSAADLGSEGTFFLDYAGGIFAFEGTKKVENYAMTVKEATWYAGTGAYASGTVAVKLFTLDGKEATYNVDADTEFCSATTAGAITTTGAAAGALGVDTLVIYSLNKDGEIDSITKAAVTSAAGAQYSAKGFLNGTPIADNVVVFVGTAAEYSVGSLADIPEDTALTNTEWTLNEDGEVAAIITNETSVGTYGVITGVAQVENADADTVYEVTMLVDGTEVVYLGVKGGTDFSGYDFTSLYAITLDGAELTGLSAQAASSGAVTAGGIKNESINIGSGFKAIADEVVVYEIVDKNGAFDHMAVADITDIAEGDTAYCYDLDPNEVGYEVIIFKAAE